MDNNQRAKTLLLWMVLAMMGYMTISALTRQPGQVHRVQISSFVTAIEDGDIGWVDITGGRVYGISKDRKDIYVSYTGEPKMIRDTLKTKKIPFREQPPDDGSTAGIIFQLLIFGVLIFFVFRMMGAMRGSGTGAAMQFGKSRARMVNGPLVKERFSDVKGVDEAVEDVADIVTYLREPKKFSRLGGRMPKGILLVGPPGTGKTLLAKALAGEAGVPFFSISGSDFVEMFVGTGASRVRDLFQEAGKNAPCIVFIDELDAVGKRRSTGPSFGSHDEREQTLNQLLVEMDGFLANQGVILVAATNKPESLDPALTRAGRFDRQVIVSPPDLHGREEILKVHVAKRPDYVADPNLDYAKIAKSTPGLTGADIESLVNEAAVRATKAGKSSVGTEDFMLSIEKVVAGAERKGRLLGPEEKVIVAWHESGHAVAGHFSPGANPVHRVSIIPRGAAALGYTMSLPDTERHLYRKSELLARIRMTLGGRAAEHLFLGEDVTSGASNDFAQATMIAKHMVTQFALSDLPRRTYGEHHASFLGDQVQRDYSDDTARKIDQEIGAIIDKCFSETVELLTKHRDKLKAMVDALLVEETLDDERVLAILGPRPT